MEDIYERVTEAYSKMRDGAKSTGVRGMVAILTPAIMAGCAPEENMEYSLLNCDLKQTPVEDVVGNSNNFAASLARLASDNYEGGPINETVLPIPREVLNEDGREEAVEVSFDTLDSILASARKDREGARDELRRLAGFEEGEHDKYCGEFTTPRHEY